MELLPQQVLKATNPGGFKRMLDQIGYWPDPPGGSYVPMQTFLFINIGVGLGPGTAERHNPPHRVTLNQLHNVHILSLAA